MNYRNKNYRNIAALKAWHTRKQNQENKMKKAHEAAKKAWATRRLNHQKQLENCKSQGCHYGALKAWRTRKRNLKKLKEKTVYKDNEKNSNRRKIMRLVKNKDAVILLETENLYAVKELIKNKIKPNFLAIPNPDAEPIKKALEKLDPPFETVAVPNELNNLLTGSYQYDFIWADYCGTINKYFKDIKKLFKNQCLNNNATLIVTYCVGRHKFVKSTTRNHSYYITDAIAAIQKTAKEYGYETQLIPEVSGAYKNRMYTIGFKTQYTE